MLELPHVLVGATIATKISNPLVSLPLAFLSNFLLDLLPHWNPHLYTELQAKKQLSRRSYTIVFIDAGLALVSGLVLAFRFYPNWERVLVVLLGCFFASIADLAEAPYFFLHSRNKYLLKLLALQRKLQFNVPLIPGLLSQTVVMGVCLWLAFS